MGPPIKCLKKGQSSRLAFFVSDGFPSTVKHPIAKAQIDNWSCPNHPERRLGTWATEHPSIAALRRCVLRHPAPRQKMQSRENAVSKRSLENISLDRVSTTLLHSKSDRDSIALTPFNIYSVSVRRRISQCLHAFMPSCLHAFMPSCLHGRYMKTSETAG